MDFGIVTAKIDVITHAENLGYSLCWVTDSQMIPPLNRQYRVVEDFADRVMARL